ncbi:MAG TPA: mannose-1-phosphate guanylyltransferase [Pirellulaceae bacterium]|nr:mannose-1-phosphate guanylyltransferase [Pirellulaceae bacterium]
MLHAIIMAGGFGTRFWPLSRTKTPKQLLDLTGGRTMIQATADRLGNLVPPERTLVITNRQLVEPIRQQLATLPADNIVGEPCKRDTAPCVALAAHLVSHGDPDAIMAVMPADHLISPPEKFRQAISAAVALVEADPERIVTFGIKPTFPAETFGYIERGEPLADKTPAGIAAFRVARFREKPNRQTAEQFLAAGNFYWNSGIFVWQARTILDAIAKHEPEMAARLSTIRQAIGTPDYPDVLEREFTAIQGKSIDYAVMERHSQVAVIEAPFAWDDVGSWQSLARTLGADEAGNTIVGKHLGIRTSGTIVRTTGDHLVATLGVSDLIVVHTPDATLVASKHDEEAIRELVKELQQRGWQEFL